MMAHKVTMEELIREIAREEAEKVFNELIKGVQKGPDRITLKEAKEKYHLFGATLYRYINNGHLSLIKMGGKSFLLREEVEKLFVKGKNNGKRRGK